MRDLTKYEATNPIFTTKVAQDLGANHQIVELNPLLQGFGHTIGNSLRRVLLTALPGSSITAVKFAHASHQYTSVEGLSADLLDVLLNLKQVVLKADTDDEGSLRLQVKGPKVVTAADIEVDAGFEVINKDLFIAELVNKDEFNIEMRARSGTGFLTITDAQTERVGELMVDAIFSPVINVSYKVEATRVGRVTDYDKVLLDITTNGSITPLEAVNQAAQILAKQFEQIFNPVDAEEVDTQRFVNAKDNKINLLTVEELELPTRIANALRRGGFKTVADLTSTPPEKIAKIKNLGEKSIDLIAEVLAAKGIKLLEK
ncbi:DNA-directed RNA polymerase subunit alpha [Microgenomates group bacterium]|nr:DNA-directed RNA polymerase subunit alpha [Microgenomates group bacterium]